MLNSVCKMMLFLTCCGFFGRVCCVILSVKICIYWEMMKCSFFLLQIVIQFLVPFQERAVSFDYDLNWIWLSVVLSMSGGFILNTRESWFIIYIKVEPTINYQLTYKYLTLLHLNRKGQKGMSNLQNDQSLFGWENWK